MSDDKKSDRPAPRPLDGVLDELRLALSSALPAAETPAPVPTEEPPTAPAAEIPLTSLFVPSDATPADAPIAPPSIVPAPPAAFDVVAPVEVPPAAPEPSPAPAAFPPIPTGIETAPESWSLMTDAQPATVPEPIVSTPSAPPPPASWLQPEAALAPEASAPALPVAPAFAAVDAFAAAPSLDAPEPAPAAPEIPIPGTVETREAPEAEPADLNDLEHTAVRPEGLVQIACLFPEGAEKTGQSFVTRLRETAARLRKPLTVQPVFLHTWSPEAMDIAAWAKSAALSGADAMFVIAPRASAPLFSKLAAAAVEAGTTGRVVAVELVPSAALYADVLIDLRRRANAPR